MSDDAEDVQERLDELLEDLRIDCYCPCDECRAEERDRQLAKLRGQIPKGTEIL